MHTYFNKAVVFTDVHFGRHSDSPVANQDNLDFIDWMIDRARSRGAESCFFLGDFFHNRATIGVASLDAALTGLERLSGAGFRRVVMLLGNHDIARRQSREISALNFARHVENITLIDRPTVLGAVTLLPWLIGDDRLMLPHLHSRYVFGHLETIGALMNARVVCSGGQHAVEADSFIGQEYIFSGHVHKRQVLNCKHGGDMVYIGSATCHDFADANDAARGAMFLEWGHDPVFEAWPDQPLYHSGTVSHLLNHLDALRPKMTVRASVDIDLQYDEAQAMRAMLIDAYGLRKLELVNAGVVEPVQADASLGLYTVDQIVIDGLGGIESDAISTARLIDIYNALPRN